MRWSYLHLQIHEIIFICNSRGTRYSSDVSRLSLSLLLVTFVDFGVRVVIGTKLITLPVCPLLPFSFLNFYFASPLLRGENDLLPFSCGRLCPHLTGTQHEPYYFLPSSPSTCLVAKPDPSPSTANIEFTEPNHLLNSLSKLVWKMKNRKSTTAISPTLHMQARHLQQQTW